MPALDLTLGLGVIRCAARVLHAFALQPFSQIARDVAGAVVAEKAGLVDSEGSKDILPSGIIIRKFK